MRQEVDSLEKMTDFFSARVGIYDDHMMNEVEGCREGYLQMAGLVPQTTETPHHFTQEEKRGLYEKI